MFNNEEKDKNKSEVDTTEPRIEIQNEGDKSNEISNDRFRQNGWQYDYSLVTCWHPSGRL